MEYKLGLKRKLRIFAEDTQRRLPKVSPKPSCVCEHEVHVSVGPAVLAASTVFECISVMLCCTTAHLVLPTILNMYMY